MFDEFVNQVQQAAQAADQYKDNPRISINKLPLRDVASENEKKLAGKARKQLIKIFSLALAGIVVMVILGVSSGINGKISGKIMAAIVLMGVVFFGMFICLLKSKPRVVTGVAVMKGINNMAYGNSMTRNSTQGNNQNRVDVIVDGTNESICTVNVASGEYGRINPGDPVLIVNTFLGNYLCLRNN